MDIITIRFYMKTICEQQSVSRAAKELGISQPALSTFVKKQEAEVGKALFDRSTLPIRLTEAGTAYLEYLDSCVNLKEEFEERMTK